MRNCRKVLIMALSVLSLVGCLALEPQIILQTRVVEKNAPREHSECTPASFPSATLPPPTASTTPSATESSAGTATPVATVTPMPLVRICFAPDPQRVRRSVLYDEFARILSAKSGVQVQAIVPDSYQAAVTALCADEIDIAWLATPSYLIAHDACGARAWFSVVRVGSATHTAEIIVQSDAARRARKLAPINSLADLEGKVFGFTDPLSTTGYLFPKAMLVERGVQLGQELFLGDDSQVALAVYKGEVDAGATYWRPPRSDGSLTDGRAELLLDYPDVSQQLKVLGLSQPIPNDPVVLRSGLDKELGAQLVAALVELSVSVEGRELLDRLYDIDGLAPVSDDDYDGVRAMGKTLGLDFEQIAEGRYMPSR